MGKRTDRWIRKREVEKRKGKKRKMRRPWRWRNMK